MAYEKVMVTANRMLGLLPLGSTSQLCFYLNHKAVITGKLYDEISSGHRARNHVFWFAFSLYKASHATAAAFSTMGTIKFTLYITELCYDELR